MARPICLGICPASPRCSPLLCSSPAKGGVLRSTRVTKAVTPGADGSPGEVPDQGKKTAESILEAPRGCPRALPSHAPQAACPDQAFSTGECGTLPPGNRRQVHQLCLRLCKRCLSEQDVWKSDLLTQTVPFKADKRELPERSHPYLGKQDSSKEYRDVCLLF